MAGTKDLRVLLENIDPVHIEGDYVFCTFEKMPCNLNPIFRFKEKEGDTLVLTQAQADRLKLNYQQVWSLITLNVHSDLCAVGFLAAVTGALAKAEISVNVASAFFHDHLFVPKNRVKEAVEILERFGKIS